MIKVAAYQMPVSAKLEENFRKIKAGIEEAASKGACLIAFPECAVSGYPPLHHKKIEDIDTTAIAELNGDICELAKENNIWVVVGTIVMSSEGLLNSALVISDDGNIAGRYDKLHLMPEDKEFFVPGVGTQVFMMNEIFFGVAICYDARFPEPFRYLRQQGARLLINISNACGGSTWKQPVLEGTYRTRASENTCFFVAVNAAGPLQMANSRICNPLGLDLAVANVDREEMLFADIDICETQEGYYYDRRSDQFKIEKLF